jgi:hypothetical protein
MVNKINEEEDRFLDEEKNESKSFYLLRADNELFNDDSYIAQKVINVKRVKLPKQGEDWEILEDNKIVLSLKGTRFTNSEREFLRTVDGMKFLMNQYKSGKKSVVKIKEELKKWDK